ncbi:MAG: AzlC family ABC transporter permease, partial [Anaerolineae bacterium]
MRVRYRLGQFWRILTAVPLDKSARIAVTAVLTLIFQWYNASQFISVSDIWPLALGGIVLLVAGIAAGLVGEGAPPLVIVLTIFVVNLRHALYSATLAPHLRRLSARWKISLTWLLTDEAFAMASVR